MTTPNDVRPLRAVAHPAFVVGLALLVLNDRVFKGSGLLPGWLTGKLSDFAGVFVAAVLFSVVVRARSPRRILLAHAAVGLGFALVKTSETFLAIASAMYRLGGSHWTTRIDPTDLLALLILPFGYAYTLRVSARGASAARIVAARALSPIAILACVASGNRGYVEQALPSSAPPCDPSAPAASPYTTTCPPPREETVCNDGLDNDHNGLIDCEDPACALACASVDAACAHTASAVAMLDLDQIESLDGDTTHGTNVAAGSCVGADSPEVIFQGRSKYSGTLTLGVPAHHGLYVRRDCVNTSSEVACSDGSTPGASLSVAVAPNEAITVVVDALDPLHPGAFHVPVSFKLVGCGDGIREDPEQCDDGPLNGTAGDACDASCKAIPALLCQTFPTATLGQTQGDFGHGTKAFEGPCIGNFDTPEQGYRYVPKSTSVTISATSTAKIGLYGRAGACPGLASLGCTTGGGGTQNPSLTMSAQPGAEMTFFVELAPGEPSNATYSLTIAEP